MALGTSWTQIASDSFTYLGYSGTAYVYAKLNRQDVTNNKSYVDLELRINHSVWVQSYDTDFYLSGYGWLGYAYRSFDAGTTTIMSSQITVNHNADGTGSFTATGGYEYGGIGIGATQFTSSSQSLPTIPRASVPTISPNPIVLASVTNTITVATNRKSTSFKHDITCTIGSYTETKTAVETSTTFDVPNTILSSFTSTSKTLAGTITCVTKNGNTTIGTKTVSFNAQIDTTQEHPNIGTITITDTNPNTAAIENPGSLIKYGSNLSASIPLTVTGSHTVLKMATVTCGNTTQTYTLSGTSQTITFTYQGIDNEGLAVTVYDERGTTDTKAETWNLIPYTNLTVTGAVDRTSETGNTIKFTLNGNCFAGSFGIQTNVINVSYKYKLHSDQNYTTVSNAFTFTPSGDGETTFNYSNTISGFDYDKQYDIIFVVADLFTSAETRELSIVKGIPVYGNGEDFFAVYGKSYLHYDRDDPSKFWELNDGLNAILDHSGNKNLLVITNVEETTITGVTFTPLTDGTVKANGTASAVTSFTLGSFYAEDGVKYVLSGCPSGGGEHTYDIAISDYTTDTGSGLEFTGDGAVHTVSVGVFNGVQVSNLIFSPMIREAAIASESFVPSPQRIYRANWTANSSSSTGTQLTQKITIPKGLYAFELKEPFRSTTTAFTYTITLNGSATNFYVYSTHAYSGGIIFAYCPTDTEVYISSSNSTSVSWTYTDRGWLKAVRIGG